MLPLNEESINTLKDHDMNAEEAFSDVWDQVWSEDAGQLMDYIFAHAYSEIGLDVIDDDTDEELYSEDYEINPSYGLMSLEDAEENYEGDEEGLADYRTYLDSECTDDYGLYICNGIKQAWFGLKKNEVYGADFIPVAMQKSLAASGAQQALLMGIEESEQITTSFYIQLPDEDEFDPSKLDFINIDEDYGDYSDVLQELLAEDLVTLNAIIYDGIIYFAGHDMIDISDDSDEEPIFDYVDENISHVE